MIDFDSLWEELYLKMTLEECEKLIQEIQQMRDGATRMLEHLVELRHGLREVQSVHGSQLDGDAGQEEGSAQAQILLPDEDA